MARSKKAKFCLYQSGMLTVVHMQQVFSTDDYYIQDEGRGHEIL